MIRPDLQLCFGGRNVSYDAASSHFLICGATNSGKTLMIRLLLQSVLGAWTMDRVPTRLLVYDAKRELLPILHGMFEHLGRTDAIEKIVLLNPFDSRSIAWDVAADITSTGHALELASIMIPSEQGSGRYWSDGARMVVAGVIDAFILAGRPWTLGDVCRAVENLENLNAVVGRRLETVRVLESMGSEQTQTNLFSTINVYLAPFRILAALWDRAESKISLRRWLRERDGVLVLGSSQTAATAIAAANRLLFQRVTQIILDELPELAPDDPSKTWIVLDEFVRIGRLDGMTDAATMGRSKGLAVVLSLQDIDGMRAVYGREATNEILGQFSNIGLLRLNSVETARWAADVVGAYRAIEQRDGIREGLSVGNEISIQRGSDSTLSMVDRPALLPSYFQRLPLVKRSAGIHGLFVSPNWIGGEYEAAEVFVSKDWMFRDGFIWPTSNVPGFVSRPEEASRLKPWTRADMVRLNLGAIGQATAARKG